FDPKKRVSDEDINEIINAGLWAPSGVNLQPWYFVAVRSPESMKKLLGIMSKVSGVVEPILKNRFKNNPEVVEETVTFIGKLGYAPMCMLAFQFKPDYGLMESNDTQIQSIAAGIENMVLTAESKGISSCWMTAPVNSGYGEAIRDEFAPGKGPLVAVIPMGYARDGKKPVAPKRKEGRCAIV
ncbi:MAG: nitroreductase family protein, partial [Lachnospiraceae bacterium]|nr:nitroreductase family protein [Lachnospiraceae bacterium]